MLNTKMQNPILGNGYYIVEALKTISDKPLEGIAIKWATDAKAKELDNSKDMAMFFANQEGYDLFMQQLLKLSYGDKYKLPIVDKMLDDATTEMANG